MTQSSIVNRQSSIVAPRAVAIIPARYDSVRFPGKLLANRTGKPLIQHVFERASQAKLIEQVLVATDDERIVRAVRAFGGQTIMTRRDHPNGTSRIAEAIAQIDVPIVVNVQGDEPEIEPTAIDLAVRTLIDHPDCVIATLASPCTAAEAHDPNVVKVSIDQRGRALYFSRCAIPFDRDGDDRVGRLRHIGLYAYRREFLSTYVQLPATPLEISEKLEQLRVLEHGYHIGVAVVDGDAYANSRAGGIDTPDQYDEFVRRTTKPHA